MLNRFYIKVAELNKELAVRNIFIKYVIFEPIDYYDEHLDCLTNEELIEYVKGYLIKADILYLRNSGIYILKIKEGSDLYQAIQRLDIEDLNFIPLFKINRIITINDPELEEIYHCLGACLYFIKPSEYGDIKRAVEEEFGMREIIGYD